MDVVALSSIYCTKYTATVRYILHTIYRECHARGLPGGMATFKVLHHARHTRAVGNHFDGQPHDPADVVLCSSEGYVRELARRVCIWMKETSHWGCTGVIHWLEEHHAHGRTGEAFLVDVVVSIGAREK